MAISGVRRRRQLPVGRAAVATAGSVMLVALSGLNAVGGTQGAPPLTVELIRAPMLLADATWSQVGAPPQSLATGGSYLVESSSLGHPGTQYLWAKPDLSGIPVDAQVESASIDTLGERVPDQLASDCQARVCNSISIAPMTQQWDSSTTPSQLAIDTGRSPLGTLSYVTGREDPESFDLTQQMQAWVSGAQANNGLALAPLVRGIQLAAAPTFTIRLRVGAAEVGVLKSLSSTPTGCSGDPTGVYASDVAVLSCLARDRSMVSLVTSSQAPLMEVLPAAIDQTAVLDAAGLIRALNEEQSLIAVDIAGDEALLDHYPASPTLLRLRDDLQLEMKLDDQEMVNAYGFASASAVGRGQAVASVLADGARTLSSAATSVLDLVGSLSSQTTVPDVANFLCVPYYFTAARFMDAVGHPLAVPSVNADGSKIASGVDVALTSGMGSQIDTLVPPDGWTPLSASDSELAVWHFPGRPASGSALEQWNTTYANFSGYVVPGTCTTNRRADEPATGGLTPQVSTPATPMLTPIFNGYSVATQTPTAGAIGVQGEWKQTAWLDGICTHNTGGYATWTGMSGPVGRLIQQGTDVHFYKGSPPFAWWEVLAANNVAINETEFTNEAAVGTGDEIVANDQTFHPDGSTSDSWDNPDGTALGFFVYEAKTGAFMNTIINYGMTINTNSGPAYAYQFYANARSDWFTERTTPGGPADYKPPYYGNTEWNYEYSLYPGNAYGQKAGLEPVYMQSDQSSSLLGVLQGGAPYPLIGTDTPVMSDSNGTGDFYSQWLGCS